MADVVKTFSAEVDQDYYLYPHQDYGLSLADWATHVKPATQADAPNKARYSATLDDTYRYWMVFIGATQPTDWSEWEYVVDLEADAIEDQITAIQAQLEDIQEKTDLITSGGILNTDNPVDADGQLTGPIVIGDDYLAADNRAFDWFIDPLPGVIGDYTCHFGGDANLSTGWRLTGAMAAVTVDGNPKWRLRFEMVKAVSSLLTARNHRWSVEVRRSAIEMTKILGTVLVVPKYTAAV